MTKRTSLEVKFSLTDEKYRPEFAYGDSESSCMDLKARIEPDDFGKTRPIELFAGQTQTVGTGVYLDLPEGVEALVRPRSGLANELGVTVLNSPGTIDPGYKGEIKVVLHYAKTSDQSGWGHPAKNNKQVAIEDGMRIAQLAIREVPKIKMVEVERVKKPLNAGRGARGFGSSGR